MPHTLHDRVRRMVELDVPAAKVWKEIGDFGAIADWHPMVSSAEVVDIAGEIHRHLTTADGDMILEKLLDTGPHHYRYEIVEGPLPVVDYRAVFSVVAEKSGCHVYWSADFEPTDPIADDVVAGIFEDGLQSIRERYGRK